MFKNKLKTPVDTKQQSISTFFKKSTKRPADENENIPPKNQKLENPSNIMLSPEQRRRMEDNKAKAEEKLKEKTVSCFDVGSSWKKALEPEFSKPYFLKLKEFVESERRKKTVFPPEKDVFSWTKYFTIEDTKVVIIGQDPYHDVNQAHGLCFSVQIGIRPPPSLLNMYKELENDIEGFKRPSHGYLAGWASQGVLLLNACLTVVAHQANSHKDQGWEKFTDATIKWIDRNLDGVVFILWGKYAEKKGSFINKNRHLVLTGKHPSPLSASRGFFGCKHFSKTNDYLKRKNKKEIDWTYLPEKLDCMHRCFAD